MDELKQTKEELDRVSPSFCLAKWLQVTIHLQFGNTHSCHHPVPHLIPLSELKKDPSALHNTREKKLARKQMLEGKRPPECDYCWKIEDLPKPCMSDRISKSNSDWARSELQKIALTPWDQNVDPSYVEVSFSSACNLKCLYCAPQVSSSWYKEIKEYGPIEVPNHHNSLEGLERSGKKVIHEEEKNPYVKAFWEWWPKLYRTLNVFRITGGEPLLSQSTYRVLDYVLQNPNPALELGINSNLAVKSAVVEKFADKVASIVHAKAIGQVHIYTSLEAWGAQAEYIRTGLDLELFQRNIEILSEKVPSLSLSFMCTLNVFSATTFLEFLQHILALKKKLSERGGSLIIDISFVRYPAFLDIHLLPQSLAHKLDEALKFMRENLAPHQSQGFCEYEITKMERLIEYYSSHPFPQRDTQLEALRLFTEEIDRRRNCDFAETFPELNQAFGWTD